MQPLSLAVTPQMVFGCHLANLKRRLNLAALFLTSKQDGAGPGSQVRACVFPVYDHIRLPSPQVIIWGAEQVYKVSFPLILEDVSISFPPALLGKQTVFPQDTLLSV